MAVSFSSNWAGSDMMDDELFDVDSALLMSFLEETQVEECDQDQLLTVMKSLEAEIDCESARGKDGQTNLFRDDDQLEYLYGWMGDQDCSASSTGSFDDFQWMGMDINMDMDKGNWYMDQFAVCGDDELIDQYGSVGDYSVIYSVGMEEQSYGSLWQES